MNPERLMNVLLAPHVTEKSTNAAEQANQVVFQVAPDATKAQDQAHPDRPGPAQELEEGLRPPAGRPGHQLCRR